MTSPKRRFLSRSSGVVTRQRVYRIGDGLEVDDVDHYEVRRSRVLYEDVTLVTFHRYRGVAFLILTALLCILFAAGAYGIGKTEMVAGWILFGMMSVPFLIAFVLRLAIGVDEINVYSRRSQARLRFSLRKGHARRMMEEIVADVRRRQDAMRPSVTEQTIA